MYLISGGFICDSRYYCFMPYSLQILISYYSFIYRTFINRRLIFFLNMVTQRYCHPFTLCKPSCVTDFIECCCYFKFYFGSKYRKKLCSHKSGHYSILNISHFSIGLSEAKICMIYEYAVFYKTFPSLTNNT